MEAFELLARLVAAPGPPGEEREVREVVAQEVRALGLEPSIDPKGNLAVNLGKGKPKVVVTAHLDEIAMMVTRIHDDGSLSVRKLGGLYPWKLGEGPVEVMADTGLLTGVLGMGSIHTDDPESTVRQADDGPLEWKSCRVFTGLSRGELVDRGVRPGTRVVVHRSRRQLTFFENMVSGYFLDDRALLVAWLECVRQLKDDGVEAVFAATVAEEVGGEGALYMLHQWRPEACIALEIGPDVVDAPVEISASATMWAHDSYSASSADDLRLANRAANNAGIKLQFQALSRGGSDASCAASMGLCARPFTLGVPTLNTHGWEVMHRDAPAALASLTAALVRAI